MPAARRVAFKPTTPTLRFDDIKKEACFILGLLAVKPEYQAQISQAGALPGLVKLLRAHKPTAVTRVVPGSGGVARRAADAITNLAHENVDIKVRWGHTAVEAGSWVACVSVLLMGLAHQGHGQQGWRQGRWGRVGVAGCW
jgi:hypothetical protein